MSHSLIEPLESRIAPASLSILDAQVSEGNSATKSLTFQITLNEPSAEQVTVLFSTSNGTATTADNDYLQVVNNAVVFAPNEITKNVTVTINGDQKPEGNETLLVTLTNPSEGTTIADGQAVGTITNDDVLLTIGDATANEDAGTLSFTVRLGARPDALTVQYSTVNGTAAAGSDFTAPEPGAQLVFAPEEFEKTITIPLTADAVDELTERFTVQLSDASFGPNTTPFTITDATGAGTIVNDDLEVSLEALQTSILEGDAELTNANYLITLSSASTHDVRVFYTTQNGTAVGGSISTGDFVTTSGSIVIAAGQTSTTISVPIVGDKVIEADETFSFSLSSVEDAILGDVTSASTTILNDDPSFRISDATLTEGDDGSVTAVFAVTLSAQPGQLGGVNRVVRVNYATADGTGETGAKDGVGDGTVLPDYEATNGTLSFTNGGPLTKTIAVTVLGDRAKELAQNLFSVNLSGAEVGTIGSGEIFVKEADATLADGVGIGTIIDNDAAPTVSINDIAFREDVSGSEGRAFAVTLSQPSDLPVQVLYNAVSGTATAGTDFTAPAAGASLTIQPGQTSAIIAIPAIADTTVEGDETFTVQLSGATQSGSALTISKNAGLGTILEDDVTVSIANAQMPEPGTTANMPFTVTLSQASTRDVVVTFNTANGTATGGSDFTAITAGSITIPAGSVTGTINVPILPDNLTETDETLTVQVTGASNAQLAAAASIPTGTILNDDAPPVISIANVTAIEGTNKAVFKVTLDHPTITPVTVKYSTANGTAIATAENAPGDYTAVPEGTVTIPAGSVEAIFEVAVANDNLDEADETFQVLLSEPSANATLPAGTAATATIQDDDASPLLSIANVQALENVAGGKAQFTVTLSTISAQEVRVDYTTAPGSAAAGADQDFLSQTGTLVFAAGETSKTVSIDINPDAVPEPDETFSVNLTNPVNALLSDAQGVGTILNDESSLKIEPTVSIAEGNPTGEPAGAFKTLTFTVTRAGAPTAENATVQFATAEGTARSSGPRPDFVATSGTLTFTGAETEKTITVQVANDLNYENDEQFSVVLSNSVNAALLTPVDATGTATITNDDAVPTLTIEDVTANEANSGTTPLIFKAKLSAANEKDANVQVTVQTANGTAVAPADFTALSATTITFAPGEVEKSITVNVAGDPADESDETFELILSGLTAGATLGAGAESATGTILDNDATPRLSISDLSYAENLSGDPTKVFTVTLSGASQNPVTVSYRTVAGTALAGTDFTAVANGLLTFAPGEISKTISIALVDDLLDEADEAFQVQLENPTNATLSDAFATGTIVDNDGAPALVINDVEIVEGDSGTSNAVFTVSLSAVSGKTVTVDFTTKDGTAESTGAFIDFEAVKGSLQFLPGETVKTLVVPIIGDLVQEQIATGTGDATVISDEQFTVELSNAANATIVDGVGAGTIGNGADSQVGLFLQEARVVEGNSGTANAVFTAVLSGRATSPVTFTLSTQSGIAIAGLDFTAKTQQLTIPTGSTQATFTVAVAGDSAFEPTEVFFVNLTDTSSNVTVVGEAVGDAQATVRGYIFNDDIQVLDGGRTIQWIDVDGDLVTLKSNKVGLNLNQGDDFTFVNAGSLGGRQLQLLDLSNDGSAFAGANISITANPQPGFPSDLVTDGRVDVGYIHAAVFDSNEFQISGIDLGTISIDGDLARIDAGDQFSTPAIKKLEVYSIGVRGTSTGAGNTASKLLGPLSTLSVEQNVEGSIQVLGAEFGKIGTIKVGGALKGGAADLSGHITATGRIGTATFGSIIGGAGDASGYLGAAPNNPVASIGTVKVLGDVIGGEGTRSGAIYATKIAAVSFGSVIGGAGDAAGSVEAISKLGTVTLTDDLRGGTGFRSGEILASGIGVVKIGGDIIGGAGERSGLLISFGSITSASTGGAVIGGGGLLSGAISAINGNLGTIQLGMNESGDSLVGGSGGSSGRVQSLVNVEDLTGVGNITSLTTAGNIRGGTGENSGSVLAFANLSKLVIGKSLIGGNSSGPTSDGLPATALDRSGMIEAGRIKSMVINENIEAGRNGGAGLTNSGAIRAHAIDSLTVKGNLVGLEANPVVIAGSGLLGTLALKSINIGGNVEFAEILAGYNDAAAGTPSGRGKMVNADASIGAVIITGSVHGLNIVAGGQPGPDGRFGTTDDPLISGTGTQDVPKVISSIASVVIKGSILTNTDPYGIVAQNIGSVRVGTPGAAVTLIKGPGNDTTPREIAPGTDFYVRELFLPTA